MILVNELLNILKKNKIFFYTGVPDSVLKDLSSYFDRLDKTKHVIAANEGSAISIGIGYHLSTKKIACVYLQNSGLGNAINPLISVAHKNVYSIPLLLMVGWRGSHKKMDEPQHKVKGKITPQLLKLLDINYCILRKKEDLAKLDKLIKTSYRTKTTVACLIEKDILKTQKKYKQIKKKNFFILRKDFISKLLKQISNNSKIISTTGYTSRELAQIRKEKKLFKGKDFYMVGGMGHSSMVSLGYSLNSKKQIICLDGDGSLLMHLGSLRTFGYLGNSNLKHILLNNNSHESVGGQPTTAEGIDFEKLVKSLGYNNYFKITQTKKINSTINRFLGSKGPSFLEVLISKGSMENLSRPNNLAEIKKKFME
jgi:phosphonopyruvate decarboxylase|tara:strand:+ start:145 stop:1248 length:1104 start_codon:yes stop_codon:yes gene_type:complete